MQPMCTRSPSTLANEMRAKMLYFPINIHPLPSTFFNGQEGWEKEQKGKDGGKGKVEEKGEKIRNKKREENEREGGRDLSCPGSLSLPAGDASGESDRRPTCSHSHR